MGDNEVTRYSSLTKRRYIAEKSANNSLPLAIEEEHTSTPQMQCAGHHALSCGDPGDRRASAQCAASAVRGDPARVPSPAGWLAVGEPWRG